MQFVPRLVLDREFRENKSLKATFGVLHLHYGGSLRNLDKVIMEERNPQCGFWPKGKGPG